MLNVIIGIDCQGVSDASDLPWTQEILDQHLGRELLKHAPDRAPQRCGDPGCDRRFFEGNCDQVQGQGPIKIMLQTAGEDAKLQSSMACFSEWIAMSCNVSQVWVKKSVPGNQRQRFVRQFQSFTNKSSEICLFSPSKNQSIYIYIYIHVSLYMYIYMYVHMLVNVFEYVCWLMCLNMFNLNHGRWPSSHWWARSQLLPSLPRYEPATSAQWVSRPEEVLQIRQVLDPRLKARWNSWKETVKVARTSYKFHSKCMTSILNSWESWKPWLCRYQLLSQIYFTFSLIPLQIQRHDPSI